jgi:uracil-DNA glycosylase
MEQIEKFISFLGNQNVNDLGISENLYNPHYTDGQIRHSNLSVYLNQMDEIQPKVLLIGEAPGHKGCRFTGVPFTSEGVLFKNDFFKNKEYQFINDLNRLNNEPSATIVWNELSAYENKPLIWNIYPFHPHTFQNINSNRTPNKEELKLGKLILVDFLKLFKIRRIGAVGVQASNKLKELGIEFEYIRHPSMGGKQQFIDGLKKIMK